jgi:hypothetical protein
MSMTLNHLKDCNHRSFSALKDRPWLSSDCNVIPRTLPGTPKFGSSLAEHLCVILESCHSTWIFDPSRMQFCRILKAIEVEDRAVPTEWRPYWGLEMDPESEAFTVHLNQSRSRMIRSWRHTEDCAQCGGHETAELSLEDIRRTVRL